MDYGVYVMAYLYEYREQAYHEELMQALRSLLFRFSLVTSLILGFIKAHR